ncbi:MAG: phosphoglucosamine mutase [Planctomycetes bacterium]|nr:phosphoglucosamine mutase [Planctomycetota bacterium]
MRAIPTLKISISGVRGVVGDSLTPTLLARFAQAFGTYAGPGRIVIGRDTRTSGEMVRQAVVAGLLSSGCRIIDLGVCPVPTVQLVVRHLGAQGGIAVTASHNPPEWNALKFVGADGLFLSAARGRELLDIYHQGDYTKVPGARMRTVEAMPEALDLHVATILAAVGRLPAGPRRLRVALDSCNGAGSIVTPRLIEALGAEVVTINTTPDGTFPRPAEPLPENLGALCAAVRRHGADIGVAQDMDADRLAVVSEAGEPIGEERTLALAVQRVLAGTPGPVVVNLSTTHAIDEIARRFGCQVTRTKVGEANVTDGMQRVGAIIGGEGNGGVIYPRINFGRDSLVGIALILHLMAETGQSVSALVAGLPPLFMVKRRVTCPSQRIADVLKEMRRVYAAYPLDVRDGVKVMLPDGWFLLRGSNTEPVVRLTVEAGSMEEAGRLADVVLEKVRAWL